MKNGGRSFGPSNIARYDIFWGITIIIFWRPERLLEKRRQLFLPILSSVDFSSEGIQVLYISPPLIALINDQFARVEDLCKYMDVPVTKWHGEANRAAKDRILKEPRGIVLITPESLEAMFVTKPYNVTYLFFEPQICGNR